eukprot:3070458-Prymnesium_polylepis.1
MRPRWPRQGGKCCWRSRERVEGWTVADRGVEDVVVLVGHGRSRDGGDVARVDWLWRWLVVVGREADVVVARRHDCVFAGRTEFL